MSSEIERKRLEYFTEEFEGEESDGMGLRVQNTEGGGSNVPDESKFYKRRYHWLKETDGGYKGEDVWRHLAASEYKDREVEEEDRELVFFEVPGWFVNDDDDLSKIFRNVHDGSEVATFGILRVESSEDSGAYMFSELYVSPRGWITPPNMYNTATIPKSVCTLYRREGEPRPVDEARIRSRDALPEEVDAFEAEEDDYDWRLALGAAYQRTEGEEDNPVARAKKKAEDLPDKLYDKLELGVDEYMRLCAAEGKEVDEEELAILIESYAKALEPGAAKKS